MTGSNSADLTTIDALLARHRYFLIDQFGVLHNGKTPYPGAIEALAHIRDSGAQSIIISNSGKRSAPNYLRMESLGFHRESYNEMITSGETAWHRCKAMIENGELNPNAACYLLSNDGDTSSIDGLGLRQASTVDEAELIMLSGLRIDDSEMDVELNHYLNLLQPALTNGTLCICTNPDKKALIGNTTVFGPGRVAEEFEKRGGRVLWVGKPYPEIYQFCLSRFDGYTSDQQSQVVCIGDSVEHDICGGHNSGLATTLVRTGIYQDLDDAEMQPLFDKYGAKPDYLLRRFALLT